MSAVQFRPPAKFSDARPASAALQLEHPAPLWLEHPAPEMRCKPCLPLQTLPPPWAVDFDIRGMQLFWSYCSWKLQLQPWLPQGSWSILLQKRAATVCLDLQTLPPPAAACRPPWEVDLGIRGMQLFWSYCSWKLQLPWSILLQRAGLDYQPPPPPPPAPPPEKPPPPDMPPPPEDPFTAAMLASAVLMALFREWVKRTGVKWVP